MRISDRKYEKLKRISRVAAFREMAPTLEVAGFASRSDFLIVFLLLLPLRNNVFGDDIIKKLRRSGAVLLRIHTVVQCESYRTSYRDSALLTQF